MRMLAVRRVTEDGERPSEVMDSLGLCRTSIYPWLRRYKDQGLETPVVASSGQRQSINVISAVNASGAFWAATYTGKLDAETFVVFLRNFMKGRRTKIFLVVDGHPAHKANIVKDYVAQTQGRLELYFLPPYAPDLNPDEFVWSYR